MRFSKLTIVLVATVRGAGKTPASVFFTGSLHQVHRSLAGRLHFHTSWRPESMRSSLGDDRCNASLFTQRSWRRCHRPPAPEPVRARRALPYRPSSPAGPPRGSATAPGLSDTWPPGGFTSPRTHSPPVVAL